MEHRPLIPALRLVITMGDPARDGWMPYLTSQESRPLVPTRCVPPPSPRSLNTRPEARAQLLTAMHRAAHLCRETLG